MQERERDCKNKKKQIEEELKLYPRIDTEVIKISKEIDELRKAKKEIYGCTGGKLDDMPKAKNPIPEPEYFKLQQYLEVYDKKITECADEIGLLLSMKERVSEMLKSLNQMERRIIELRYFQQYKWDRIDKMLHYTQNWTIQKNNQLIEKLLSKP
jgi:DNA-directed RNA polymerase specialized sigma subunit